MNSAVRLFVDIHGVGYSISPAAQNAGPCLWDTGFQKYDSVCSLYFTLSYFRRVLAPGVQLLALPPGADVGADTGADTGAHFPAALPTPGAIVVTILPTRWRQCFTAWAPKGSGSAKMLSLCRGPMAGRGRTLGHCPGGPRSVPLSTPSWILSSPQTPLSLTTRQTPRWAHTQP